MNTPKKPRKNPSTQSGDSIKTKAKGAGIELSSTVSDRKSVIETAENVLLSPKSMASSDVLNYSHPTMENNIAGETEIGMKASGQKQPNPKSASKKAIKRVNDDPDETEIDDLAAELERSLASDLEETAEAELAALLAETGGSLRGRVANLRAKLELYPDGAFPISEYSQYCDSPWILSKDRYGIATKVYFGGLSDSLVALKKALTYHGIPEFAPFGSIRSYQTTASQASLFRILDEYIFKRNYLDGDGKSIALINAKMINKSLDVLKELTDKPSYYIALFYIVRLWGSLSVQGFMPDGLQLAVDMRLVDTIKRQKELLAFTGSMSSWLPYSQEELGSLVDFSLFWTETALPELLDFVEYVESEGIGKQIIRSKPDLEIEKKFSISIQDRTIISLSKCESITDRTSKKRGIGRKITYSWLYSYSTATDNVRNALYVLLALITGLRVGELMPLRFDDITKDGEGNYTLKVVRFKTSNDPNFNGETDYIPLPKFVGDRLDDLRKLRSVHNLMGKGFIFASCKGRRAAKTPVRIVTQITNELSVATGVDRIHTHRFRKTIAEILINRNERNIDIIRHLFGHKSYAMTLRYIGRNPYLVRSIALAIQHNYTAEFTELINAVSSSASSGPTADRLIDRIRIRPEAFVGKQLKVTIFAYVSHLLSSGEPLFIHRTALGRYCLSTESYSSPNVPPCLAIRKGEVFNALPDPNWCDVSCEHAVVIEKARVAMEDNVRFYRNMLENASDILSARAKNMLRDKIAAHNRHLDRLCTTPDLIPLRQVKA